MIHAAYVDGMDFCTDACQNSGPIGEFIAFAVIGGRLLFAEVKRRKASTALVQTKIERDDLRDKVRQLSAPPPDVVSELAKTTHTAKPSLEQLSRQIEGATVHVEGSAESMPSLSPPAQEPLQPSPQAGLRRESDT